MASTIGGFYPGIEAQLDNVEIVLQSTEHDSAQLAFIWQVALANEQFCVGGREHRRALLCELLA